MNVALSYISNIQDAITFVASMNNHATAAGQSQVKQVYIKNAIPAASLHADYTQGAFSIDADYVMVNKMKNTGFVYYKAGTSDKAAIEKAAMPSAYNLQAVYGFTTMGQHKNYVTLGFGGTQDALGFTPFGGSFNMPKDRILVNYKYDLMKNVSVEAEYDMDADYGKKHKADYTSKTNVATGTGYSNDTITARLNVAF
jgi:hypothetical protein